MKHKQKILPAQSHRNQKLAFLSLAEKNTFGDVTFAVFSFALMVFNAFVVVAFNRVMPGELNHYPNYLVS